LRCRERLPRDVRSSICHLMCRSMRSSRRRELISLPSSPPTMLLYVPRPIQFFIICISTHISTHISSLFTSYHRNSLSYSSQSLPMRLRIPLPISFLSHFQFPPSKLIPGPFRMDKSQQRRRQDPRPKRPRRRFLQIHRLEQRPHELWPGNQDGQVCYRVG